ncbi:structural maintenance of chromosomes protein [Nesidiocoris tenuis]|uniref:Structural maintenance of chromosomes protein n=1 Tax=Nesidiocoris tenuis TaxID=355587 RepID=A0ABN7AMA5_9HEMI|nr:structural maintenance of chromosomes protein [Nesidiocoris tenuis]
MPPAGRAPQQLSDESEEEEEEGGRRIAGVYIPPAPVPICSTECVGPRLIISKIVNENFKSYAGRQVLGHFHKNFTSIIGPNGSGKSNVIDSMLFVFGYRANKIRSKKLSVLIHKSENHQNIRSATVAVHFVRINDLPGDDYEIIPNSEFVISRTVFNDNTSYYCVDGKRVQFREVAQILRTHGIDLIHNRFLILQGEVEQIAMMKPKGLSEHETGMLEYLEDIIATSRYKKPLAKLEKKCELLTEERTEKANRVKIAEKDREAFRKPMEEAIEFLEKENEHTQLRNKSVQIQLHRALKKVEKLEAEKKTLDEALAGVIAKMNELKEKQAAKNADVADKEKEFDAMKKQKEQISDAILKFENALTVLNEDIKTTNKNRKKAIEAKKNEEQKLNDYEKLPEKNKKGIEELEKVAAKLKVARENEEKEVEKALAGLRSETQELQEQKEEVMERLLELNNRRDTAKNKYDKTNSEMKLFQNKEKNEKENLEKLIALREANKNKLRDSQMVEDELKSKLPRAEQTLGEATRELETLRKDEVTMAREFNTMRARLEEKRSSANAFTSRNKVLNFIMQKKAEGVLPGVFGRLGDLGGIDPKYDCAVSTACGLLDHIITDTVETASQCLEQLKKYDVGRGRFIALDKQQHLRSIYEKPFSAPQNIPRLFDLIRLQDERMKPAFYFALRNTLVANDLNQARSVAYGATRYRVVTLEGEIIEIEGTMSGGGREKRTGRMGRSATVTTDENPAEIAAMESRLEELGGRLAQTRDRIRNREDTVSTLTRDTQKWKVELSSASNLIKDLIESEPSLDNRIKQQEAAVKAACPDPGKVYELTTNLESLKEEYESAKEDSAAVQKEADKLTAQIKAITGGRMKEVQKKLDDTVKKLEKVEAEITKLTVEIQTSARNSKKSATKIGNLTGEITESENLLRKYSEEVTKIKDQANAKDGELAEINEKLKEASPTIKKLQAEVTALVKEMSAIKSSKMDEEGKVDIVKKKLKDANEVPLALRKELSKFKLHNLPFRPPPSELKTYTLEELSQFNENELEIASINCHDILKKMKPNLSAINDFNEKDAIYKTKCEELDDVTNRRNEVRQGFEEVRKARLSEFMEGFHIISYKLKEMYQTITLGGDAEFELVDSLDPFVEGVSFSVRPPRKSWKNISNLSGGEKTLSSLALVFALHYYKPSPLYVMDEIDAALDFKNVSIVGNYIKERTKNAQFIVISLRSNMFELANHLVGIYKTNNCTKSCSIIPEKYARMAEAQIERGRSV